MAGFDMNDPHYCFGSLAMVFSETDPFWITFLIQTCDIAHLMCTCISWGWFLHSATERCRTATTKWSFCNKHLAPYGRVDICEPIFYQVGKKVWWGTTIKDGMRFLAWFYNGWKPYTADVFTHKYEITSLDLWIIVSDTFALYILLHFSSDTHQHTTKTLAYPCL
jgi:hypothetical protein